MLAVVAGGRGQVRRVDDYADLAPHAMATLPLRIATIEFSHSARSPLSVDRLVALFLRLVRLDGVELHRIMGQHAAKSLAQGAQGELLSDSMDAICRETADGTGAFVREWSKAPFVTMDSNRNSCSHTTPRLWPGL